MEVMNGTLGTVIWEKGKAYIKLLRARVKSISMGAHTFPHSRKTFIVHTKCCYSLYIVALVQ